MRPGQATNPATVTNETLQDIVVVARRIAENQQRVPVAVTAQSGEALQQQNAVRVPDIARLSPGISFAAAAATPTALAITVRGQVQTDVLATLDPSVGTYVDGFYWARAYGLNADLLDVQSAQVLRGPQGTLFGRNTTGGALLLQTNDPDFNGVSGSLSATYGRFNERIGTAILNLPLVEDKVALRGAFSVNKRDGFFTNDVNGHKLGERNSYAGRVKLLLKPTETLSLLLSGEYFRTNAITRPFQLVYASPTSPANIEAALEANPANAALLATPAGLGQLIGIGGGIFSQYIANTRATDHAGVNEDPRSFAKAQTYMATATLDTFFGSVKLIGGYRRIRADANLDLDGSPVNIVRTEGQQSLESYSGEFQVNGQVFDDRLNFTTGLFAFHEGGTDQSTSIALPVLTRISSGGILPRTIYFGDIKTNSMGLYAQGTFRLDDRFSVVGGLRYSIDDKGITSFNRTVDDDTGALLQCLIVGSQPGTCRIHRSDEFKGWSYTAGLNYQITPDMLLYIKTSKGFRSGGQNLRASGLGGTAFVPFQPEIAREHEVGFKGEFLDHRLRFNIAAFYNKVSDIQRTTVVTTVINGVTSTSAIVSNAGKARFWGGEAELAARLFSGFTLSATGAMVQPKYLKFADDSGDRRDEAFQFVTKYNFSLAADYEHELGFGRGTLHVDYAWRGRTPLNNFRTIVTPGQSAADVEGIKKALTATAGGELNARAGVSLMDDSLELAVFGRNILNRRFYNTGLLFSAPLNVGSAQRNDPVTYGVTATFRFGH
ncbi:TonB-dependent receptor [Sphingobium sp. Sx8-8]|uniref:TonB-dependent receptor n=1 Tax=Sphingobium sp. Sx8-8 TaxID=2933617 RepID=UPI001F589481